MNRFLILTILCSVCAVSQVTAQTTAPEGMVQIPAGKFWMGRTQAIWRDALGVVPRAKMDDRPANHIYLDAFYIDKYEVTNADYARFLQATGTKAPWHWRQGKIPEGEEKQAVSNVNWFEATAYCKWAGKRLPTEAEWEKASRGGLDRKPFSWGDVDGEGGPEDAYAKPDVDVAALNKDKPMKVGSFAPNGYGLHDMTGNVDEWINDWYDQNYYAFMPKKNPQGPETGLYKGVRGASWADNKGELSTNFYRNFSDPELRSYTIGFRCAK
jgi:formylglycine-generating enzyme required for sulfatase activity